ncbi:hypothetical protein NDU88_003872 [Pleurodeles waltl]|uniref:Uncharacterized protein n=1 Tax=Pleurodeles waltl TaxID=8319 RepID=A0AAV7MF00_PLEWA|nr:hypothetical protein NDU88_003872 [Pleurodeles waltl]
MTLPPPAPLLTGRQELHLSSGPIEGDLRWPLFCFPHSCSCRVPKGGTSPVYQSSQLACRVLPAATFTSHGTPQAFKLSKAASSTLHLHRAGCHQDRQPKSGPPAGREAGPCKVPRCLQGITTIPKMAPKKLSQWHHQPVPTGVAGTQQAHRRVSPAQRKASGSPARPADPQPAPPRPQGTGKETQRPSPQFSRASTPHRDPTAGTKLSPGEPQAGREKPPTRTGPSASPEQRANQPQAPGSHGEAGQRGPRSDTTAVLARAKSSPPPVSGSTSAGDVACRKVRSGASPSGPAQRGPGHPPPPQESAHLGLHNVLCHSGQQHQQLQRAAQQGDPNKFTRDRINAKLRP